MAPHRHIQRAGTEFVAVARGASDTHIHLRNRLLAIFWITVVADVIATGVVWIIEHDASGSQIHDLFDAFLFSTSQLLTAASVASPTTDGGKVLELIFGIYALTVVAALAGSFGAFFHRRGREQDADKARRAAAAGHTPA